MTTRRGFAPARHPIAEAASREAAQKLSRAALKTLREIMGGEGTPSVRLAAAREVLDRAYGRPRALAESEAETQGLTVIVKRYSDVTAEEEARGDEGEP